MSDDIQNVSETALKEELRPVSEKITEYFDEAVELRFSVEFPKVTATPQELWDFLLLVRGKLTRLEAIIVSSVGIQRAVDNILAELQAVYDEAWDTFVSENKSNSRGSEFTGPRERYADANLATMSMKRKLNVVNLVKGSCDSRVSMIRFMHKALDSIRQDTLTLLKSVSFVSNYEV